MRIGVNIPNELYRRLKPIKQYINVSQICREAIEDYVDEIEKTDIIDRLVERISEEHRKIAVDWKKLGRSDAKFWVNSARLEEWQHLLHRLEVLKRQNRPAWEVPIPYLKGNPSELLCFAKRSLDFHEWFIQQWELDEESDHRQSAEREYMRAWVAYTMAVWDKIRQLHEAKVEEMRNKQTVPSEVEVPKHLLQWGELLR